MTNMHFWVHPLFFSKYGFKVKTLKSTKTEVGRFFAWQQCYSREFWSLKSKSWDDTHHMLNRIWKRIRFCPCRTGMIMRKTAIRRQRKNTMVWTIMPAGERSELQGLSAYILSSIQQIYTAHPLLPQINVKPLTNLYYSWVNLLIERCNQKT